MKFTILQKARKSRKKKDLLHSLPPTLALDPPPQPGPTRESHARAARHPRTPVDAVQLGRVPAPQETPCGPFETVRPYEGQGIICSEYAGERGLPPAAAQVLPGTRKPRERPQAHLSFQRDGHGVSLRQGRQRGHAADPLRACRASPRGGPCVHAHARLDDLHRPAQGRVPSRHVASDALRDMLRVRHEAGHERRVPRCKHRVCYKCSVQIATEAANERPSKRKCPFCRFEPEPRVRTDLVDLSALFDFELA